MANKSCSIQYRILNILVCFNNADEIVGYAERLDKINRAKDVVLCIVIGDNYSFERISKIESRNIKLIVYNLQTNVGYMNGAIIGYMYAKHTLNSKFDWIIISNADIDYQESNFIEILLRSKFEESIGCIGPDIYVPKTGEHQNPAKRKRMSRVRLLTYTIILSNKLMSHVHGWLSEKRRRRRTELHSDATVYMVHGTYFILREDVLETMKRIPYNAFLYSEELYVAEILRLMNLTTLYTSSLAIIHNEHTTTSMLAEDAKRIMLKDSYKFIYETFY